MFEKIKSLSSTVFNEAVQIRRHLHKHPELSFKEFNTADFIANELDKIEIPYRKGVGGNGMVATLKSNNPDKKIIALRADFDALPILEETNLSFSSENNGVMHACGHDIHSSSLLSVIKVLKALKSEWEGTIHFVFQHAEELIPGGASLMLKDNLFGDLQPEYIIAQHVEPDLQAGTFGIKPGRYMASNDEIYLTIHGKGGHGAMPHKFNDTVLAAAHVLVNLQQISSRLVPANVPMVLSFGKVVADGATNVIPDKVEIQGTFRMFDEELRSTVHQHIERISKSTAEAFGTTCEIEIRKGYPVVDNNEELSAIAKETMQKLFGKKNVIDLDYRMTSEDFAFFSQKYKSVFYRLGVGRKDSSLNFPLHSSKFNPDEEALKYSIQYMSSLALKILK